MPRPVILVVAPMPVFPTSSGSRRRLLATCEFLKRVGFDIDFAYLAHEDQIYHRFGQVAPTDMGRMVEYFRKVWLIELNQPIKLKTGTSAFELDDWCPQELCDFVAWYFKQAWAGSAILVNYVFLSACLLRAPVGVLRIIDTHDRFSDRRNQYLPFRLAPNFFYTNAENEREGLSRADVVVAIQPAEQDYFERLIGREVALLMPDIPSARPFSRPRELQAMGFMGHGNDANLVSISRFASAWRQRWQPGLPKLLVAGEICSSLPADMGPGIQMLGYVHQLTDFFDAVDIVVAPMLMGTGLKLKVVEALAHGKPVVGTGVAFEGLSAVSPDHGLRSISSMIDRIVQLGDQESSIAQLAADSETVFENYCHVMRRGAERLAADLAKALVPARSTVACASIGAADEIVVEKCGALILTSGVLDGTTTIDSADSGLLLATEFLAPDGAETDWTTCCSPNRRHWWAKFNDETTSLDRPPMQLSGSRISIAPTLIGEPRSDGEERLILAALVAIGEARPDWQATGEFTKLDNEYLTVMFRGPSFLLRPNARCKAYILPVRAIAAVRMSALAVHPMVFRKLPPLVMTSRCGDSSSLAIALRGTLGAAVSSGQLESSKLLVVSEGLCGHVLLQKSKI